MEESKVGKKIQCKQCHKKVTVLEITRGGSKIICAPCKECTHENIISTEKWERGPAEVDLLNPSEVIRHIRDMINLSSLFTDDLDDVLYNFNHKLRQAGYSEAAISGMTAYATRNTRYDFLTDPFGRKLVPRAIPDNGKR